MKRGLTNRCRAVARRLLVLALALLVVAPVHAQRPKPAPRKAAAKPPSAKPKPPARKVGFPQDAGPHDLASIEWWYFNSFFTTEKGKRFAVVGSFFRVGLPEKGVGKRKGHYLLYALADLDEGRRDAYSVLDRQNIRLLKSLSDLQMQRNPGSPAGFRLRNQLDRLEQDEGPGPHRRIPGNALVKTTPRFYIGFEGSHLSQESDDGRTWQAVLSGDDWTLDLTLTQPIRPALLPGGKGMTGVKRPDEMYYLTLSRMEVAGTLERDGVVETVNGVGWLDRQWGSPAFVANYGWDWLGVQLDDGAEILMYRIRDAATGKVLRVEATVLLKDGTPFVEKPTAFAPVGAWTDPATKITFPAGFVVQLPTTGYKLTFTPAFPEQTIPVIGIGDAIWEGVVEVKGTGGGGESVTGRGYMELVGYKPKPVKPAPKPKP